MPQEPPPPHGNEPIEIGGPPKLAYVSLQLTGDSLIPNVVSQLLGCQPSSAKQKGDIIPDEEYHRVAYSGSWNLNGDLPKTTNVEEQIVALLSKTTSDLEVWRTLASTLDVRVSCGLKSDSSIQAFNLSPEVTSLLADRCINLGICVMGY